MSEDSQDELKEKQVFLRKQIIDQGFDPDEFGEFIVSKKEHGEDLNNWEKDELIEIVKEFKDSRPIHQAENTSEDLSMLEKMPETPKVKSLLEKDFGKKDYDKEINDPYIDPFDKMMLIINQFEVNCKIM